MNVDDILGQLPIDQIAEQLGVDHATATEAVEVALPVLLGGMRANAEDQAGAASLTNALGQHQDGLLDSVLAGGRGFDQVDTTDGDKIVGHVFGTNRDEVVNRLAGSTSAGRSLLDKLLPMLAPLVMSYLAKRVFGGGSGGSPTTSGGGQGTGAGGFDIGDILGQVLAGGSRGVGGTTGGGTTGAGTTGAGIDLGDLLGGLLGGGRR